MRWIEAQGGVEALEQKTVSKLLIFMVKLIETQSLLDLLAQKDRSEMNATFNLVDPQLAAPFDALCETAGISGLKGHRSVGGYRASIYNALPMKSCRNFGRLHADFRKKILIHFNTRAPHLKREL